MSKKNQDGRKTYWLSNLLRTHIIVSVISPWMTVSSFTAKVHTPPKTNMDTQNDALEKGSPFQKWQCLVSMLDFWSVSYLNSFPDFHVSFRPPVATTNPFGPGPRSEIDRPIDAAKKMKKTNVECSLTWWWKRIRECPPQNARKTQVYRLVIKKNPFMMGSEKRSCWHILGFVLVKLFFATSHGLGP